MIQKNNSKCFNLLLARELTHLKCMEDPHGEMGSARSSENLQKAEDLNLRELFIFASSFFTPWHFMCFLGWGYFQIVSP